MEKRIRQLLREKNLSAVRLAGMLGVQPSSISHLISGRNKPNYDFIAKLLRAFPEIDPDWFLLGEGEMFRSRGGELFRAEKELSLPFDLSPKEAEQVSGSPFIPSPSDGKQVERIVFFYTDRSFSVYEESR